MGSDDEDPTWDGVVHHLPGDPRGEEVHVDPDTGEKIGKTEKDPNNGSERFWKWYDSTQSKTNGPSVRICTYGDDFRMELERLAAEGWDVNNFDDDKLENMFENMVSRMQHSRDAGNRFGPRIVKAALSSGASILPDVINSARLGAMQALTELTKGAFEKGFLTFEEALTLKEWALEIGTKGLIHDPHDAPVDYIHAHIGTQNHMLVK